MKRATLRSRLILGFAYITVPLVLLLLWNNTYAMDVVHSQVSLSNKNLTRMYMSQIDQVLEDLENYVFKTASQDNELISLSTYDKDNPDAYLAKVRTLNNLYINTNYYRNVDALFAYNAKQGELLMAAQQDVTHERKQSIKARLDQLMAEGEQGNEGLFRSWMLIQHDGQYSLVRVVDTGYKSYVGAWIDIARLMVPLNLLHLGTDGQALFLSKEGIPLTHAADPRFNGEAPLAVWKKSGKESGKPYKIVQLWEKFLLVIQPSAKTDIQLVVMIPEHNLLEGLAWFQRLTYYVPLLAVLILVLYLLFLQRSIYKPITQLITGMRRIYSGDLSVRFTNNGLMEFRVIGETFNTMVKQIEVLKIDVYEEQIRTQRAELKHLQAQIHPHFFMNSLNIVYNLAQTRQFDIIQQMAIHLVKYFRFAIRTHAASTTMKEELEHIASYLGIQQVRFPETLDFAIHLDPELESCRIPPSTILPLVENAMIHGFTVKPGERFSIEVCVKPDGTEGSAVLIEVRDNGRGFGSEPLARLQASAFFDSQPDEHIGLWNVVRRCKFYYKSGVRVAIGNGEVSGAVVTLSVPRCEEEE
ncbi:histidine kinase [Paenibacillus filicis]|uniref:Histidine kinase n=1 Tax=Paenibacillus filicis TaxID=669464 RepID=A0ABU9DM47_9BACL